MDKLLRGEKMRFVLLSLFVCLPLFCANILNYELKENGDEVEMLLFLDDDWNGTFTQKKEGGSVSFVFENIETELSLQESVNSSLIEQITLKTLSQNEAQLTLQGGQIFDISLKSEGRNILLTLTPQPTPLSLEGIAKEASQNSTAGIILDALFYVVIFLALLAGGFFVFVKFKLFPYLKSKNAHYAATKPQDVQQDVPSESVKDDVAPQNIDEAKPKATVKTKEPKAKKPPKPKQEVKKPDKPKGLFDT
jgi:hypothetical protein